MRYLTVGILGVVGLGGAAALAQVVTTPAITTPYPPVATPPAVTTPYQQPPTYTPYQPYTGYTPTGSYDAKNPLLLAFVIQPLLQQGGASLVSGIGALFTRLFNALGLHSTVPPSAAPSAAGQYPGAPGYPAAPAAMANPGYAAPGFNPATPGASPYAPSGVPAYGAPGVQYAPAPGAPQYGAAANAPGMPTAVPQYAAAAPGAAAYSAPPTPAGMSVAAPPTPAPPAIAKSVVLPSIVYSLRQLDPKTYASARQIDLAHGAPTLRTDAVFAIEYSTNLSGQVRIDNIDSEGQVSPLGTYSVLSGHDNRIPRTKGIKLVGTTGTETFKLYFLPCIVTDASGHADAAASAAGLPACPDRPSPSLLEASKGLVSAKAAVNLESPDPTIAVSAFTDFKPSDVTENDFQIRHVARN